MESEVVKYAPKEVIDELDKIKNFDMIYELFQQGCVLDANTLGYSNVVDSWVYGVKHELTLERELAVINHVFGIERLQPEREPRWYVDNLSQLKTGTVITNGVVDPHVYITGIKYEWGMTEKQAKGYAELFGGKAKEIK